jgi:hypothetical protein
MFCMKYFCFQKVFFILTLSTLLTSRNCIWIGSHLAAKTEVIIGIRISCFLIAAILYVNLLDKASLFAVAVGRLEVVSYILGGILSY